MYGDFTCGIISVKTEKPWGTKEHVKEYAAKRCWSIPLSNQSRTESGQAREWSNARIPLKFSCASEKLPRKLDACSSSIWMIHDINGLETAYSLVPLNSIGPPQQRCTCVPADFSIMASSSLEESSWRGAKTSKTSVPQGPSGTHSFEPKQNTWNIM